MIWIVLILLILAAAIWWLLNSYTVPSPFASDGTKLEGLRQGPLAHIRSRQKKEELEDLIKYLYHHRANIEANKPFGKNDIVEELGHKKGNVEKNIQILRESGLLEKHNYLLTPNGQTYALGLIRVHRLYERFLAEHSGYKPSDWHRIAEQMEHRVNPETLQAIEKTLHKPLLDPHGDPIPSEEHNHLPTPVGIALDDIAEGDFIRIKQMNDDDEEKLTRLTDLGLFPGALIQIVGVNQSEVTFIFQGEQSTLTRPEFEALTIARPEILPQGTMPDVYGAFLPKAVKRLTTLSQGHEATICGIDVNCRGTARRRLLDLGFVRGSKVSIYIQSPMGNPNAYLIRGSGIALRQDQAKYILIDPQSIYPQ